MQNQWECKLLTGHGLSNTLRDEEEKEYGQVDTALLNDLGKEGWEVCSHTNSPLTPTTLILKRKLS